MDQVKALEGEVSKTVDQVVHFAFRDPLPWNIRALVDQGLNRLVTAQVQEEVGG